MILDYQTTEHQQFYPTWGSLRPSYKNDMKQQSGGTIVAYNKFQCNAQILNHISK